ncbi:MAG TPA: cytochrome c oxidase subunit II [Pelomicrobium sp.]|nr:cytochrome c oxidase subunit II [Pelomicrobium sp.]
MRYLLGAAAGLAVPSIALSASKYNLQPPNSPIAEQIYDLHTLIMIIITVIFVGVFAFMFYAVFKHRKAAGHKAAHFHENTTVEVIWTVIPFFILIGMAYPATKTVIDMKDTAAPEVTIKATGYQWKWQYDYLDEGISFLSNLATPKEQIEGAAPKGEHYLLEVDNPMVVPVGKKIRILTTAGDVLHAWYVPAFGVKQDAIPGFIRDTWFRANTTGEFRGQCAELCGKEHGFMPIVVKVVEQAEYDQWVKQQKQKTATAPAPAAEPSTAHLVAQGEKVFTQNCVACHQADGRGVPGTFPALAGSKVVAGPAEDQIRIVLQGKPGTAMASFSRLTDEELAAVISYTRQAWNNGGEAVQPADVKALRTAQATARAN